MVISHKHKYLFIEIPSTASWAIHLELCEHYAGEPILHKHASYLEFQRVASATEQTFYAFATVRNPLDEAVSGYYKLKTDHKGTFTDAENLAAGRVTAKDIATYDYLQRTNASFKDLFERSRNRPYDSMISFSAKHLDYVIRYENLQDGFAQVLSNLDIEQVRALPVRNKTDRRKDGWRTYYDQDMYEKAARKYGPFMEKWGYSFPEEWGDVKHTRRDEWLFHLLGIVRCFYMTNFRYNDNLVARIMRSLRARLF